MDLPGTVPFMNRTYAPQDSPTTTVEGGSEAVQNTADLGTGTALVYSPRQAADALCVSVDTIRRMVNRRQLPHVRVGSQIRIPAAGLRAWLKANIVPVR